MSRATPPNQSNKGSNNISPGTPASFFQANEEMFENKTSEDVTEEQAFNTIKDKSDEELANLFAALANKVKDLESENEELSVRNGQLLQSSHKHQRGSEARQKLVEDASEVNAKLLEENKNLRDSANKARLSSTKLPTVREDPRSPSPGKSGEAVRQKLSFEPLSPSRSGSPTKNAANRVRNKRNEELQTLLQQKDEEIKASSLKVKGLHLRIGGGSVDLAVLRVKLHGLEIENASLKAGKGNAAPSPVKDQTDQIKKNHELLAQLRQLKNTLRLTEDGKDELSNNLTDANNKNAALRKNHEAAMKSLKEKLAGKEGEIENLKAQHAAEMKALQSQLTQKNQEIEALKTEHETAMADLRTQLEQSGKARNDLQNKLKEGEEERTGLINQLKDLNQLNNDRNNESVKKISDLEEALNKSNEENEALRTNLDRDEKEWAKEIQKLQNEIKALKEEDKTEIVRWDEEKKQLQKQIEDLQKELEKKNDDAKRENDDQSQEMENLRKQIEDLKKELEAKNNDVNDDVDDIDNALGALNLISLGINDADSGEHYIRNAQERIAALRSDIESTEKVLTEAKSDGAVFKPLTAKIDDFAGIISYLKGEEQFRDSADEEVEIDLEDERFGALKAAIEATIGELSGGIEGGVIDDEEVDELVDASVVNANLGLSSPAKKVDPDAALQGEPVESWKLEDVIEKCVGKMLLNGVFAAGDQGDSEKRAKEKFMQTLISNIEKELNQGRFAENGTHISGLEKEFTDKLMEAISGLAGNITKLRLGGDVSQNSLKLQNEALEAALAKNEDLQKQLADAKNELENLKKKDKGVKPPKRGNDGVGKMIGRKNLEIVELKQRLEELQKELDELNDHTRENYVLKGDHLKALENANSLKEALQKTSKISDKMSQQIKKLIKEGEFKSLKSFNAGMKVGEGISKNELNKARSEMGGLNKADQSQKDDAIIKALKEESAKLQEQMKALNDRFAEFEKENTKLQSGKDEMEKKKDGEINELKSLNEKLQKDNVELRTRLEALEKGFKSKGGGKSKKGSESDSEEKTALSILEDASAKMFEKDREGRDDDQLTRKGEYGYLKRFDSGVAEGQLKAETSSKGSTALAPAKKDILQRVGQNIDDGQTRAMIKGVLKFMENERAGKTNGLGNCMSVINLAAAAGVTNEGGLDYKDIKGQNYKINDGLAPRVGTGESLAALASKALEGLKKVNGFSGLANILKGLINDKDGEKAQYSKKDFVPDERVESPVGNGMNSRRFRTKV